MSVLDELIKRASTNKAWAAAAELDRLRSEKQELRQILGDLIKIFSSTDVAFFGEEQQIYTCHDMGCDEDAIDQANAELSHLRAIKAAAIAYKSAVPLADRLDAREKLFEILRQAP